MRPESSARENVSMKMVATMATVLIIAAYSLVVSYPFLNWGDPQWVMNNPAVGATGPAAVKALFSDTSFDILAPVTLLSFAFEQGFAGLNSNTFHFDNIILHLMNTLLLLGLLMRLFPQRPMATAAAVFFFAVHPLHVETVSWVAERKDLLCAFFFLISVLTYLEAHRSGARWYITSFVSFAFSVLSSPLSLAMPLLIFLIESFVYRNSNWVDKIKRALGYAVIAGAFIALQESVLKAHGKALPPLHFDVAAKASFEALAFYISKSILPSHLSALYEGGLYHLTLRDLGLVAGVTILVSLAAWQLDNIRRAIGFGLLFFLIMILPALALAPMPHRGIFADSDFYIAGMGLILVYALIFSELVRFKKLQIPLVGVGAIVIGAYLAVAHNQTDLWNGSDKLWANVVKQEPGSSRAHINLGEVLYERGETIGAGIHYFQALKLNPESSQALGDIGLVYLSRQRFDKAQEYFKKAIDLVPQRADLHLALGMAYVKSNHREEGLNEWKLAEKLDPKLHDKIILLSGEQTPLGTPSQKVPIKALPSKKAITNEVPSGEKNI